MNLLYMEQAGFIACVDFGTSDIIGLLGRRNEQDVISIIASESIPSDNCVKHGIVYNIDEAAGKIKKLLNLLENKVGKKIGKVYVSISGMSLKAIEHIQTQRFPKETEITFAMLEEMQQQARMNKFALLTNYSVVAPEIFLDSRLEQDYIGKKASTLEVRYRLIAGRPNIKANLKRCITDKNQVDIAGYIVGPIATAALLLSEEEKQKGCALIDFGGGTSTVSIYTKGILRTISVIPFGGRTITRDIQSLGLPFDAAESFKIRYGQVGKDKNKQGGNKTADDIDLKELNKIIGLRQDEILLNVINQIDESGYKDELGAGIILTGGASQMKGLPEYLAEKSKLPVKIGSIQRLYINNATDLLQDPSYAQSLGLMLFAKDDCEKVEPVKQEIHREPVSSKEAEQPVVKEEEPISAVKEDKKKPKRGTIRKFFEGFGGTLFDEEE
ncbi:MAG: cell division protein FtsA [Dysgonomonas sp.]